MKKGTRCLFLRFQFCYQLFGQRRGKSTKYLFARRSELPSFIAQSFSRFWLTGLCSKCILINGHFATALKARAVWMRTRHPVSDALTVSPVVASLVSRAINFALASVKCSFCNNFVYFHSSTVVILVFS